MTCTSTHVLYRHRTLPVGQRTTLQTDRKVFSWLKCACMPYVGVFLACRHAEQTLLADSPTIRLVRLNLHFGLGLITAWCGQICSGAQTLRQSFLKPRGSPGSRPAASSRVHSCLHWLHATSLAHGHMCPQMQSAAWAQPMSGVIWQCTHSLVSIDTILMHQCTCLKKRQCYTSVHELLHNMIQFVLTPCS